MKITKVETIRLERPQATRAFGSRRPPEDRERHLLWVRLHTDEGQIGLGETFYGARAAEAAVHELFAPLLIGRNPFETERLWLDMFRLADHFGYGGAETRAISAIDTAVWDVVGQALEQPIYQLLGGACRSRVRAYDTGGGPDYPHDPIPYVQALLESGITAMKVGAFPEGHEGDGYHLTRDEIDRIVDPIRRIRDAFGDRMGIAVDGHGFWSLHTATQLARALEPYGLLWFEEPLSPRNVESYLKLSQQTAIPVCGAERLVTRFGFREFIERGAVDIVMPDLVWTGGISETKKISILAETHQLPVSPHDCTGPVNLFACAHVCVNIPNAMLMETSRVLCERWYGTLVYPTVVIEDGHLLAPEGPGLGTRLRAEVFERPDVAIKVSDDVAPHYLGWRH